MSKFCVAPGVSSKVATHFDVEELYTKTIPFCNPAEISTSLKPPKVPPPPENDDKTLTAFCEPTLTDVSY